MAVETDHNGDHLVCDFKDCCTSTDYVRSQSHAPARTLRRMAKEHGWEYCTAAWDPGTGEITAYKLPDGSWTGRKSYDLCPEHGFFTKPYYEAQTQVTAAWRAQQGREVPHG